MWLREPGRAADHAEAVIDIGEAHDLLVWSAVGTLSPGRGPRRDRSVDDGLARFETTMEQYHALQSPPVFWPSLLMLHATILGEAGPPEEGLVRIEEAIQVFPGFRSRRRSLRSCCW